MENGQILSLNSVMRALGVLLIAASIIVGIVWAITKKPDLEPIAFVLATAGGLLLTL